MSNTPRTDAMQLRVIGSGQCHADDVITCCDFARKLERQIGRFSKEQSTVKRVNAVIDSYYKALSAREHGGVAQDRALTAIESILGRSWRGR